MTTPPRLAAQRFRDLREAGLLRPAEAVELERFFRTELAWRRWISRLLVLFGAALLLAGVVFFFAYNWRHLGPREKFAIIEAALLTCAIGAAFAGLAKLGGQVLLFAASVLVGVFLAVFGQIYQTGADSYQLFAAWAALIIPWVTLGRFAPLVLLWITLINVAAVLFWAQAWPIEHTPTSFAHMAAALGGIDALILAAREMLAKPAPGSHWLRRVLSAATIGWLTVSCCATILLTFISEGRETPWPFLALLAGLALGYWTYKVWRPDLFCLATGALSVCVVICTWAGRLLFHDSNEPVGSFFALGIVTLAVFGAAIFWLRRVAAGMALRGGDVT